MGSVRLVAIAVLKPHRLQHQVFPGRSADQQMIESVRNLGVIEMPTITEDNVILSGFRRIDAAEKAGIEVLSVNVKDVASDSPEADEIWIATNIDRSDLTNEQKARLYAERKKIEEQRAQQRADAGRKKPRQQQSDSEEKTDAGILPASNSDETRPKKSGSKKGPSARDIAGESVGLAGKTAEKLLTAVAAKDKAVAAGDTEAAEKILDAIETNASKAVKVAAETGYLPASEETSQRALESPQKTVAKLREKAANALTAFIRALEPHEQDVKTRSLLSECGIAMSDDMSDNLKPHTAEEFIVWMKDQMEDLTQKEHVKASELGIVNLLQNVKDPGKLVLSIVESHPLKPTSYLGKLPDQHQQATEQVEAELKIRFKQLRGFENWDQNGRPAACRSLCKATRSAVKSFENHCAVGDEEQPALVDVTFPEKLDTEEFRKVWGEYWDHRKKTKKPITETVRTRSFNRLTSFPDGTVDDAIAIVGKAIESDWKGIPDDVWNTIWTGPDAGKKRPETPKAAEQKEDIDQLFQDVLSCVKKTWHPDLRNRDEVFSAVAKLRDKTQGGLISEAVSRIGVSSLFVLVPGTLEARNMKNRFQTVLFELRQSKGAA